MKLYHGSSVEVAAPKVSHARKNLDFGRGFYLTSFQSQAERWAKRKAVRYGGEPIVNIYELSEDLSQFKTLHFKDNDKEWVEFVCDGRRGGQEYADYDIIIGAVANDKVYAAVDMYFKGLWDIDATLKALKFYELNDQICLVSQRAIDELLVFVGSYEVR
ncbi:MAG: DUF3990 domain-containing protein [Coriobacteriales bacterium]|jgi:hypothetical protein|nr:DUF3990 domain-containing protein [Coriobacteriales bacterium]